MIYAPRKEDIPKHSKTKDKGCVVFQYKKVGAALLLWTKDGGMEAKDLEKSQEGNLYQEHLCIARYIAEIQPTFAYEKKLVS